jgi:ABC-2 type transport system ATP-binding protein
VEPALEAEGVVVRYGKRAAVDGVSLRLAPGEIVALLGPNGAGKSTLLGALGGVLDRAAGKVSVAGHDLDAAPLASRAALGLCGQPPALYEFFTVREHLSFVAEARTGRAPEDIGPVIEGLGLAAAADRPCRELSFGMRQRVGLGATLVGGPRVLLLDEPLNGLDPRAARRAREALSKAASGGAAVLLSTHLLGVVEHLCTRLLLMTEGHLRVDLAGAALDEVRAGGVAALEALYFANVPEGDEP